MTKHKAQLASGISQADLNERLGWLVRLRWLAGVGLFVTIVIARYGLGLSLPMLPLLVLNGTLVLSNAVYWHVWKTLREAPVGPLVRFGVVQSVLDYVILTIILHYTGGIENPLIVTFVFQCTIASMLFRPGLSYLLAGLAIGMVGAMVVLEQSGIWPHVHLGGYLPAEVMNRGLFVAGVLVTLAVVLLVSVYLTTTLETASRRRRIEAAKRSRELEEAREQVQQADKMAALGELAASMAHDINNPAGVLCSRLEVMEAEGAFQNLPDRLRRDLGTLRECAQYLRRVAENWTGFVRKTAPRLERVNLNEAIRRTAAMVAESLVSHGIRLHVHVHESPLWVHGDLVRLQQVVLNLVNNARDAMPQGGVLTIRTRTNHDWEDRSCAVLEVQDTGTGIAPEDMASIFEPFFSKKPRGQGTGLGLAICQKIVREMDGEIRVNSRPGEGTVFAIRLHRCSPSVRSENHGRT